ncbi:MAG: hypothetical protein E6H75_04240 [Betaproteobacteria bacterium]|nr:MAG: hypothetical protein E6H75_04240 [Betaproteobacteria bacterium]
MKENSAAVHAQVPVDVATFLLNEKRADIHSIEARLKVNVVLIPNVHLETPNYKVERLRHDDLNQAEALPASYDLATPPAEEEAQVQPAQEAKVQRQQAAVRGVTPERPAPVAAQYAKPESPRSTAPRPGIIGRIFGWFKRDAEAPARTQPVPAPGPRREQPDRSERRERGDRDRFRGRGEVSVVTGAATSDAKCAATVRVRIAQTVKNVPTGLRANKGLSAANGLGDRSGRRWSVPNSANNGSSSLAADPCPTQVFPIRVRPSTSGGAGDVADATAAGASAQTTPKERPVARNIVPRNQ